MLLSQSVPPSPSPTMPTSLFSARFISTTFLDSIYMCYYKVFVSDTCIRPRCASFFLVYFEIEISGAEASSGKQLVRQDIPSQITMGFLPGRESEKCCRFFCMPLRKRE